jgi:dihydrodipicolinate synthase/N-acetylneuraminate lyase
MTDLRGCIPILCTSFFDDSSVDYESLERQIDWVIAEGASGVATLALASEGYKLTESERDEITRVVVAKTAGRVPVVVSADGGSPEVAIDRALRAQRAGATALMVLPASFVKPGPAALRDYYVRIGRAVKIPLIIQDAPQLTGVPMEPALWADLAREVETIQYVKAEGVPQGQTLTATLEQSEGRLTVFCGWGGLSMIDAMERGAAGSMPAANFTRLFADIQRRFEAGDVAGAESVFQSELPYVLWAMQSIDFSVRATKSELLARAVFRTRTMREPWVHLDLIAEDQLARFIAGREIRDPTDGAARA